MRPAHRVARSAGPAICGGNHRGADAAHAPVTPGAPPTSVAGEPVTLRLIVSEVPAANGRVLAQWLLLSNVAATVAAGRLALWYYWRWRIESFFKLLKGAG